jgi:hypothetical protein
MPQMPTRDQPRREFDAVIQEIDQARECVRARLQASSAPHYAVSKRPRRLGTSGRGKATGDGYDQSPLAVNYSAQPEEAHDNMQEKSQFGP